MNDVILGFCVKIRDTHNGMPINLCREHFRVSIYT